MAGKRKNGEGSYGEKSFKGVKYKYYRSASGKYIYAKTSKELSEKVKNYNEKIREEEQLVSNSNGKLTVYEYATHWLKSKRSTIKPKTYDGYEFCINILEKKELMLGDMQIKSVDRKQIQRFLDDMSNNYSRNTITKERAILNQIFDEAIEDGLIISNPVNKTMVPIEENIVKDTKEIVILEHDDITLFKNEANREYKNGKCVYGVNAKAALFILETGLRAGELIALKWDNVDIDNKKIYVKENAVYIKSRNNNDNKYELVDTTPKSKKGVRTIPLSNEAINIINWCKENNKGDYVFSSSTGGQLSNANLDKTIMRIAKSANLSNQNVSAHPLRHTFASVLLSNGVEISVVSKLLGHSKISTTYDIYIHIMKDKDIDAISILNNIY